MKVPFRSIQRFLKLHQLWIWEHLYDMILWNSLIKIIGLQNLQTSVISTIDQLLTEYLICMHFPQREITTHNKIKHTGDREREMKCKTSYSETFSCTVCLMWCLVVDMNWKCTPFFKWKSTHYKQCIRTYVFIFNA